MVKGSENSGKIKFDSPSNHTGYAEISSYLPEVKDQTGFFHGMTYDPKVGRMITFPSSLRHEVDINKSKEDRISISYNIHVLNPI